MRRRRFLRVAASTAAVAPFAGIAGCGNSSSNGEPEPVPPSDVVLSLPKDMYQHAGAPTEWWWHIGTLRAGDRTFGFEINAASFQRSQFAFTQIMLTDVAQNRHFKRTTFFVPAMFDPDHWSESDPAKDWFARLGDPNNQLSAIEVVNPGSGYTSDPTVQITGGGDGASGGTARVTRDASGGIAMVLVTNGGSGYTSPPDVTLVGGGGSGAVVRAFHTYVAMQSPADDPTRNMKVQALLVDDPTDTVVEFDLMFSQQGRPFFVWGTGVVPGGKPDDLQNSNYYFSLTRMHASGTIEVGGESFEVSGITWMDHEYGAFGTDLNPVKWILQDMQLDNGFCISNYATISGSEPMLDVTAESHATLQDESGNIWFVPSFVTPVGRTWTSPETGRTYFTQFHVEIPSFEASFMVTTLVDSQEFPVPTAPVYEGVAEATGTFRRRSVSGTAWIEQAL